MIASRKIAPTMPDSQIDRQDAARRLAARVERLLAERPGRVEAVDDEQGHEHAEREDRQVCRRFAAARCPPCRTGSPGLVVGEEQQDQGEDEHARGSRSPTPMLLMIDRSRTPNALMSVVVIRAISAMNVNMSSGRSGPARRGSRQVVPMMPTMTSGTMTGDGGHGHDLGPEVEPAREPAERPVRRAASTTGRSSPATGKWLASSAKIRATNGLAEDDDRPRPEERRAADAQADAEVRERAGRDADVAERDREVRQEPEDPLQLRLDPERAQMRVVALGAPGPGPIPPRSPPPTAAPGRRETDLWSDARTLGSCAMRSLKPGGPRASIAPPMGASTAVSRPERRPDGDARPRRVTGRGGRSGSVVLDRQDREPARSRPARAIASRAAGRSTVPVPTAAARRGRSGGRTGRCSRTSAARARRRVRVNNSATFSSAMSSAPPGASSRGRSPSNAAGLGHVVDRLEDHREVVAAGQSRVARRRRPGTSRGRRRPRASASVLGASRSSRRRGRGRRRGRLG